ncbi:hypothetical protein ER308_19250 [Egibacter rhizosphaerae]|uniref:Uncharacterized protein n=1 Tax=Egibacter rhizosphaerae TaxID=1670831 RepID=A0A411YJW6_9ACTN|nr:hypothetical protein [Egibacter rhizosphaerae]QBI21494.1 hypothetical protein ER308_19250 [Egibacter rhizosphaerae]
MYDSFDLRFSHERQRQLHEEAARERLLRGLRRQRRAAYRRKLGFRLVELGLRLAAGTRRQRGAVSRAQRRTL